MSEKNPDVSIIVPCYNQGEFLSQCLLSVLHQTVEKWECIVVDDGSTDNTRSIAGDFVSRDQRFRYHFQENRGLSAARNSGLSLATGRYLNFLDSDDLLLLDMLQTLLREFQMDRGLELVFSGYVGMDGQLATTVKKIYPMFDFSVESFFRRLCKGNLMPVHTVLLNHGIVKSIGTFDETLKSCEDWDFWLRVGRVTNQVKAIPKPLVIYRMSPNSMTRNAEAFFRAGLIVLNRTVAKDSRVEAPLAEYEYGHKGDIEKTMNNWYRKGIGLHLANKNLDAARLLLVELRTARNIVLSEHDFLDVWRDLLFGAILSNRRREAWKVYGTAFMELVQAAADLYQLDQLTPAVRKRTQYFNAPFLRRIFMRLFF